MTGNAALKVTNAFARIQQRVHSKLLAYFTRLTCPSRHHSHIILAQIYQFLEEYWKANSISCTVIIMVLADTSDDECTRTKFKTCALQCSTHCAVGIRSLILAA